ncbi:glycosyltransferase family 2 protein [Sabulicella glaciei]|uniref:Glycosyltransferase family 2 protein n=1 Tax=Sabulicella glaciei TaxID=2984948 RepID=A0ABT3NPN3_9PROT|nr:glycosyltransferase family 2 protein [Roseococcus sp. MDT2-1-1]MCW8084123.1 glycosyltransferase family 2 protein [Roseococcus sp. MDT2-1-1]
MTEGIGAVSAVVVSFNSAEVLPGCLASIPEAVPLVVVDNASGDGSADLAARLAPRAQVLRPARNLGFGRAANLGFAEVKTPFGILLNADVRCRPGMFEALLDAAQRYPGAGMLAPCCWAPDGALQFGRPGLFEKRGGAVPAMPSGDCCAPYVGGSAMFFRMDAFRAVGGFDDALFLYFEDDDLCFRLRRAGHSLVHVQGAALDHAAGRSSAPSPRLEWWKHWHMAWSALHMERKHRGRVRAAAHGVGLAAELAARLAFRPFHPSRAKWSARLAGTLAFLRGVRAVDRPPEGAA